MINGQKMESGTFHQSDKDEKIIFTIPEKSDKEMFAKNFSLSHFCMFLGSLALRKSIYFNMKLIFTIKLIKKYSEIVYKKS